MQKRLMFLVVLSIFVVACSHIPEQTGKVVVEEPQQEFQVPQKDCIDEDNDGYGEGADCKGIDCNDKNPLLNPGMKEICGDNIDNDCRNGDDYCPDIKDSDKDGINDIEEGKLGLNLKHPDSDGDGLFDLDEIKVFNTDPLNPDSDGDSWLDGCERTSGTNPLDLASFPEHDEDNDGLDDEWELEAFTTGNIGVAGLAYGPYEDRDKANKQGAGKGFGDELNNLQEYCYDLDPRTSDTDKDNVEDNMELTGYFTDPKKADTDGDGYNDGREIYIDGTDPSNPDSHIIYSETRNVGRRFGATSEGSYRRVATYLGESVNTDNYRQ